jgi:aminoglycoside 6'-N-acetyltransferase I
MQVRIVDLTRDSPPLVNGAAELLHDAFRNRSEDWQDIESARREVVESLKPGRVSRAAIDESNGGAVVGWIGAIPTYGGRVWEIHPLVVAAGHRRRGIGRQLVLDIEGIARHEGALTLWCGSDDENNETTLSGVNLYRDIAGAIRGVRNLKAHPYEFYLRVGFTIVGVMPDANGPGRPDIFLAKPVGRHMYEGAQAAVLKNGSAS